MDLVKSWAAGIGILFAGTAATFVILIVVASSAPPESTGAVLLWSGVPTAIVYGIGAFAAAALHPRPARDRGGRHVLAVIGPPVVMLLLTVPFSIGDLTAATLGATVVGAVVGTAAGWTLGDLVRRPRRQVGYSTAYRS